MAITLLNRDHYRSNIQKVKKRFVFRLGENIHGHANIISIADLLSSRPRFTDSNGEFLFELSLSRIRTLVEKDFLIQRKLFDSQKQNESVKVVQLPSSEFNFGSFSWVVVVSPEPIDMSDKICVHLIRKKTTKQHTDTMLAKIRYRFFTGQGDYKSFNDPSQEVFACEEEGSKWVPAIRISELFRTNLQVRIC